LHIYIPYNDHFKSDANGLARQIYLARKILYGALELENVIQRWSKKLRFKNYTDVVTKKI
jgi:hypothetical protein